MRHVCWKPKQFNQQRWPLQGNNLVNTLSPWQRWCHATIGELQEAVLPCDPAPGRQGCYNGTMWYHITHINIGMVFSVGSMWKPYLKNQNTNQSVCVESLERDLQADRSIWFWGCCETGAPGGGMRSGGAPIVVSHCVTMPSYLWDRRQPAMTIAAEHSSWGSYSTGSHYQTTNWSRQSRLRRICVCYNELQSVWISDCTIFTCSYSL
jgi:hypothetical protein